MQSIIKLRTQTEPWPKNIISVSDGLKRDIREQENERRTLDLFGRDVSLTPARGLILKKSDKIKIPIGRPLPDDGFSISRDLKKNADLLDALESIGRVTYGGTDPTNFPDIDAPEKLNRVPLAPQFPGYANASSLTTALKKAKLRNAQNTQESQYPYEPEDPEDGEEFEKYQNSMINRGVNSQRYMQELDSDSEPEDDEATQLQRDYYDLFHNRSQQQVPEMLEEPDYLDEEEPEDTLSDIDVEFLPEHEYEPDQEPEQLESQYVLNSDDEFEPEPRKKQTKTAKKGKAKAEYVPEPVEDSDDEYMPIIEYEPEPRKKQTKTAKKGKAKVEYVPEPVEFLEEERKAKANKDKKRAKKEKQKAELQPEDPADTIYNKIVYKPKGRDYDILEPEESDFWNTSALDVLDEIRESQGKQGKQAKQQKDQDFYHNINNALLQQMNEQEEEKERKKEINKQSKRRTKQEEEEEYDYLRREAVNKLNEQGSSSSKEPIMKELEEIRAPEIEDKILDPNKSRKELDSYVKKYGVATPSRNENGNKTKDTIRQDIRSFLMAYRGQSGNGLRRLRGYGVPNRNYLTSFGSYLIDQDALYRNTLELYDRSRKVLSQHVSDPIKYVIKDMINGNRSINEYLTNEEYNELKKILQFVRLPNPIIHEKRKAGSEKGDLLSLQRRFEILTGEANAGNDGLGPKIIKVVKEMYDRGLINKRLYDEAVRTYNRTPIIY